METVGERIYRLRKEQGLSCQELAKRIGVSYTSVVEICMHGECTKLLIFMRYYAHSAFSDNCRILPDFVSVASK